ncbi:hypothetical protein AGMMS49592_0340 [Endomicrobiia bacterium]|nr:hypothetical protein AGMMS49592_0340 [Endomicrobiia bacterium]
MAKNYPNYELQDMLRYYLNNMGSNDKEQDYVDIEEYSTPSVPLDLSDAIASLDEMPAMADNYNTGSVLSGIERGVHNFSKSYSDAKNRRALAEAMARGNIPQVSMYDASAAEALRQKQLDKERQQALKEEKDFNYAQAATAIMSNLGKQKFAQDQSATDREWRGREGELDRNAQMLALAKKLADENEARGWKSKENELDRDNRLELAGLKNDAYLTRYSNLNAGKNSQINEEDAYAGLPKAVFLDRLKKATPQAQEQIAKKPELIYKLNPLEVEEERANNSILSRLGLTPSVKKVKKTLQNKYDLDIDINNLKDDAWRM